MFLVNTLFLLCVEKAVIIFCGYLQSGAHVVDTAQCALDPEYFFKAIVPLWCNVLNFAIWSLCQVAALKHAHMHDKSYSGVLPSDDVMEWSTEVLWTAVSGHKHPVFIL